MVVLLICSEQDHLQTKHRWILMLRYLSQSSFSKVSPHLHCPLNMIAIMKTVQDVQFLFIVYILKNYCQLILYIKYKCCVSFSFIHFYRGFPGPELQFIMLYLQQIGAQLSLVWFVTDLQEPFMLQEWSLPVVKTAVIYMARLKINLHTCSP